MSYIAYHFTVEPVQPGSEILIALISDLGFESFDYSESGFTAYITEEALQHSLPPGATEPDFSEFRMEDFTFTYTSEKIEATNWNAEWEKNFEPVLVDDLLCIRAPFHEKNNLVRYEIVIMPKMSFGTGHHQTTRLMCRHLFATALKDKRVLDMGCGTGILAILAKILGAGDVIGIDIDEWSVENAIENCASNAFPDITIYKGDVDLLDKEAPFDVILANINKNILRKQLPAYSRTIKKEGILFLSGFFTTDVEELIKVAAVNGFIFQSTHHENEWAMMILKKS